MNQESLEPNSAAGSPNENGETSEKKLSEALQFKLKNLPTSPGVYQFKDKDERVIYVGKAKNLRARVQSYFRNLSEHSGKTRLLVRRIMDLELILTGTEVEALILENNLIKQLKPRYNINLKDDKSYPYIVVTNEPFPRVFPTRNVRRDGSKYYGPYTETRQMRMLLDAISEIFQVRSCSLNMTDENIAARKFKVCLDYHIKKCLGPCEALQSREDYDAMIDEVKKLLRGKTKDIVRSLESRMKNYAKELKFEYAAEIKRQLEALERYSARQKVLTTDEIDRDIFAVAREGDDACGTVFKVRDGKLLGSQHFYFSNVEDEPMANLVGRLLEKYYLETTDILPNEIFTAEQPSNQDAIEALLQKRMSEIGEQKKVHFVIPQIGDKAKLVDMCAANAKHLLSEYQLQKQKRGEAKAIPHAVRSLERDLRLAKPPRRIECFDNSNFQGTDPVASMICFVDGKPKKSDYRRFKIKTVEGANDFASMAEIIERRYTGSLAESLPMPDLIVVDGGKGQLSSAYAVLQKSGVGVPVIGLAKRLEEVFFPNEQLPHNLPKTSSSLKLLQQVRDEAHRFAITFHRELRSKRTLQTELTEIEGIGKTKAEKLLKTFGSVAEVKKASAEALAEAVGKKAAERIFAHFQGKAD
ncbi:excinuclease ABC, C subunit [Chloroherpeton thalassium ATCC 35110]|uniref:UvrABC system protein C n=1 Tax=Chloroherpeton thalassium (strain ATCC 35110 / GB-78) TaxID=517418 RepID=B3QRR8_CHLT3|nr:excinuclease ABC subunit UvrC [Chloroherpeton thalassium]ACF13871.1 excinuclease ABC, C subunit [Chloroherpeton thalassium ATCC 35110]